MMSRTLAHARRSRRQALQRFVCEGSLVHITTIGVLTVDHAADSLGFFTAHDDGGQAHIVNLSDVTLNVA